MASLVADPPLLRSRRGWPVHLFTPKFHSFLTYLLSLPCRERHVKCDEKQPTCGYCSRFQRRCAWGLRISFSTTRISRLSESDAQLLVQIESQRRAPVNIEFVNENREIESEYLEYGEKVYSTGSKFKSVIIEDAVNRGRPKPAVDNSTKVVSPSDKSFSNPYGSKSIVTSLGQNGLAEALLMSTYFWEVSKWCEVTDSRHHFSTRYGHMITKSQLFHDAALMLAAKQLEKTGKSSQLPDKLDNILERVAHCLQDEQDKNAALLVVVLLGVYYAMNTEGNDLRQHLQRCSAIFLGHTLNGSGIGLTSACFWEFARLDAWAAYSTTGHTVVTTDVWSERYLGGDDSVPQDSYCHRAIWIFSQVVNQLAEVHRNADDIQRLWAELQAWIINRPDCLRPILELDANEDSAFPTIMFSNTSAVCGNIFYHTSCVLLLSTGCLDPFPEDLSAIFSPVCHSRRIAGISTATNDHANWINNIEPIYLAARHYPKAAEKIEILRHLRQIEIHTGWRTSHKSEALRLLWGIQ